MPSRVAEELVLAMMRQDPADRGIGQGPPLEDRFITCQICSQRPVEEQNRSGWKSLHPKALRIMQRGEVKRGPPLFSQLGYTPRRQGFFRSWQKGAGQGICLVPHRDPRHLTR